MLANPWMKKISSKNPWYAYLITKRKNRPSERFFAIPSQLIPLLSDPGFSEKRRVPIP